MEKEKNLSENKINYWDGSNEYVVFSISNCYYAIKLNFIKEIVKKGELLPVPDLPSYILGLTNIRGEIFPVFDLKNKFSLENTEKYGKYSVIIILIDNNKEFALVADSIIDIFNISHKDFTLPIEDSAEGAFIEAEVELDEKKIKILELSELFQLKKLH